MLYFSRCVVLAKITLLFNSFFLFPSGRWHPRRPPTSPMPRTDPAHEWWLFDCSMLEVFAVAKANPVPLINENDAKMQRANFSLGRVSLDPAWFHGSLSWISDRFLYLFIYLFIFKSLNVFCTLDFCTDAVPDGPTQYWCDLHNFWSSDLWSDISTWLVFI